MGLYERIGGFETPKIPVHSFFATMQEYVLGNISGAQATAAFGLSGAEATEAAALRDKILEETNANATLQGVMRRLKAVELENVLILLENRITPLHTVAAVKARLGVS